MSPSNYTEGQTRKCTVCGATHQRKHPHCLDCARIRSREFRAKRRAEKEAAKVSSENSKTADAESCDAISGGSHVIAAGSVNIVLGGSGEVEQ